MRSKIFAGLISLLFLTSCDSDNASLTKDFDRTGETMHITTIWHKTQADVDRAYVEEFGRARNEQDINRLGFAVWANPGNRPYWCRIHSIEPKRGDDDAMDTLGHELAHCLVGRFHPEP